MQSKENTEAFHKDLNELYERIYSWHQSNKGKAQLSAHDRKKYMSLVHDLPDPEDVSLADIAFVVSEINDGIMTWSIEEKDESGVKIGEYARKTINKLGGGLQTRNISQKSKLAWKYWSRIYLLKRILGYLSGDELRKLYLQYNQEGRVSQKPDKAFIIKKIIEEIPSDRLLGEPGILKVFSQFSKWLFTQ